jgi:alpha-glucosidase
MKGQGKLSETDLASAAISIEVIHSRILRIRIGEVSEDDCSRLDLPAGSSAANFFQPKEPAQALDGFSLEASPPWPSFMVRDHIGKVRFSAPVGWCESSNNQVTLRFALDPAETIHGLGQATMEKLDLRGAERRMWHEVRNARYPCVTGIPFVLSSAGWGVVLNSGYPSRFVVGDARLAPPPVNPKQAMLAPAPWPGDSHTGEAAPDRIAIVVDAPGIEFFVLLGDTPADVLHLHHVLTGGASMLPAWGLGYIQSRNRYRGREELISVAREFRERRIPCDTVVIDWYWFPEFGDFDWDVNLWPDIEGMVTELKALGFTTMVSLHPYVDKASRNWNDFVERGILVEFPPDTSAVTSHDAILDITHQDAVEVLAQATKRLFAQGLRAWWLDQIQPEVHPVGARHRGGGRERVHNVYPLLFSRALHDAQREVSNERVFILAYSAWETAARYGIVVWTGDVDPTWEVFREQIVIGQQLSLSGLPYWTTDQGGYVHYPHYDPELFVRWTQWGAFCPVGRTHSKRPESEPWSFGDAYERLIGDAIRLRYRFIPYLYQCMATTVRTGQPIVRPMLLACPGNTKAAEHETQFFVGSDVLVAPVCEPGTRVRSIYLPDGSWYDWWTDKLLIGGTMDVFAPLGQIPVFVRAGAILPLGPKDCRNVAEALDRFQLHLYPGQPNKQPIDIDDGTTNGLEAGNFGRIEVSHDGTLDRIEVALDAYGTWPWRDVDVRITLHSQSRDRSARVNGATASTQWDDSSRILLVQVPTLRPSERAVIEIQDISR